MEYAAVNDKIVCKILEKMPMVTAIYLFGSRADGTFRPDSDFDLAILFPHQKQVSDLELFNLQQDLSVMLNQDVDLICLNKATLVMQFQVTSHSFLLFEKTHEEVLKYEALVLSMYQRFNEERKPILEEIQASGKIYSA